MAATSSGNFASAGKEASVSFCCPECRRGLVESATQLDCPVCDVSYPLVDGIPMFSRNRDFYYGEIPRQDMRAILARAPSAGLETEVISHADRTGSIGFYRYAYSPRRSAARFLLPHFGTGTVLDFGCGLGAITSGLAQSFARVYSTDLTWERAAFTRCRTQQLGLHNVTVFCSGDTPHIPLPAASVDVVVINGVLEWLPQFLPGDPRQVQLAFLRELRTVLKPDGCVFLGIENRIAYGYFAGAREEHTSMLGVSLLPRPVANVYSRIIRGKPYRNYTHTRAGQRALFREAGFAGCDFFGFVPCYLIPRAAFRLSDPVMIDHSLRKDSLRKRIRNILVRPLLPHMAPSLGVLGFCRGKVAPFVDTLLAHISGTSFAGNKVRLLRYDVTATGKVNLTVAAGQRQYVVKLPLTPESLGRTRDEVENLEAIASSRFSSAAMAPRVVEKGSFSGQYFAIEDYLGGRTGDELSPRLQTRALQLGWRYTVDLARNSAVPRTSWSEALSAFLIPYARDVETHYRERFGEDEVSRCSDLVARLMNTEDAGGAFECAGHGDFWLSNLMVDDRATRLLGVIDWNQFSASSLPLLDLFHLLVKLRQENGDSTLGDAIAGLHRDIITGSPAADLVSKYAREFSIPQPTITHLLAAYWLRQTRNMLRGRAIVPGGVIQRSISLPFQEFSIFARHAAASALVAARVRA